MLNEGQIELQLIKKLTELKYTPRPDIRDRAALERNFREKFEALNRVRLADGEFSRLLDEIITPDVFAAARTLRERNSFTREDGTPLNYTLVNIRDWCKNTFEVVNQLRINTDNSHHRFDVILLVNGVPAVQIELKTLGISPRRAMEQLVGIIQSDAKFMNEREDIAEYIATLKAGEGLGETAIREGYARFKAEKDAAELAEIASKHGLSTPALQDFVDGTLQRMIFDGEQLSELYAPYDLGWKERTRKELLLMEDCAPYLTKRAQGRDISGLSAYEQ